MHDHPTGKHRERFESGLNAVTASCLGLAAFRIWCCLCFFPTQEWNDVRLRASFLIADGLPLYPGLEAGPITTWIYGPIIPLMMLPATLASTIDAALLVAGALNAVLITSAFTFACLLWPHPVDSPWSTRSRFCALGISLLLLPQTFFIFLQADNASLACGLISLTCLAKAQVGDKPHWWWMAASFGSATAFAKLHGTTLLAAEMGWVWFACTPPKARQFALQLILSCSVLAFVTLQVSATPNAAWEMMVKIPSRLPFTSEWGARFSELMPFYALLIVLPGILLVFAHRCRPLFASGLSLSAIVWLASLPLGIAGTLTSGGAYNSLHGAFYLLPLLLTNLCSSSQNKSRYAVFLFLGVCMTSTVALLVFDRVTIVQLPKHPDTTLPIEAASLASQFGPRVWMPWRPLATRFATGRHDHDEDGLHVRQLTASYPTRKHVYAYLPPAWDTTIFQAIGMNWNVALSMQTQPVTLQRFNRWVMTIQPSPPTKNAGDQTRTQP